eukprot:scaffold63755_cov22-Tisochrysis_lutea.AAC.2
MEGWPTAADHVPTKHRTVGLFPNLPLFVPAQAGAGCGGLSTIGPHRLVVTTKPVKDGELVIEIKLVLKARCKAACSWLGSGWPSPDAACDRLERLNVGERSADVGVR